uniref:Coiled-coil domain containing 84 n=1 Tax=Varanus komodoensis TaxID=61221 RepID=A0A8D2IZB5_VARKO
LSPAPAAAATVFRCSLCRRSAFAGRRSHLHSAGHQRRLRARPVLGLLQVDAAREVLRRAVVAPVEPAEHERRFWCACCGQEVRRHLSHGGLAVPHGGLLQHLASAEHKKAVSAFWWEHKADPSLKPHFLVSSEEYELFKASLSKALDTLERGCGGMAAHIREVEQSRQEMVDAVLEVCTPLPLHTRGTSRPFPDNIIFSNSGCQDAPTPFLPGPSSSLVL